MPFIKRLLFPVQANHVKPIAITHTAIRSDASHPEKRRALGYNNNNNNNNDNDKNVPVRPKTRVTLTSLTGTFADSIFDCVDFSTGGR